MKKIEKYIYEYLDICESIRKNTPENIMKNTLYIKPVSLRKMMDKKLFEESDVKLRIWRNLGWLQCDQDRFTKKITHKGKQLRVCVLNKPAFYQLRELMEPDGDSE